jgi:RimJ/RimL family protein N-acetyltransferase
MPEPVFSTRRMTLRLPRISDAPQLLSLVNQADFIANIRDKNIHTIEDAEHEITDVMLGHYREHGFCLYAMDLGNEPMIGLCGLIKRPELAIPDIGFAIRSEFQNKGLVTEAGVAVLQHAFVDLKLATIAAIVRPDNLASISVIDKLGMRFVDGIQLYDNEPRLKYFELSANQYLT